MDKEISSLRQEIEATDDKLFELLAERFKLTARIGEEKKKLRLAIKDGRREQELIDRIAGKSKLNKDFITKIYKLIFETAYDTQK